MGTAVFFEKDNDAPPLDPLYEQSCRQQFKFVGKTNKVINFERIYVEKIADKKEEDHEMEEAAEEQSKDSLRLKLTYEEAIKQFPSIHDPQWKEKDLF